MPSKKVEIVGLLFDAVIGLYESERESPQEVELDITFFYDYDGQNLIDYMDVITLAKTVVINKKFFILEESVEVLKSEIKKSFPSITSLEIAICKPAITQECKIKVSG